MGYNGQYSTTLPTTELGVYRAIFVCVGIYPNNYIIGASSQEASALVNYVNTGGRLYLEGGDVWYYDPQVGGYNFCPLFGISATEDGTSDLGPIQGQTGTFTNLMYFNYAGENNYMDQISPSGTGAFLIFKDVDQGYDCGVARDAGTYRTVGVDFELGSLVDGSGVSTRAALLDSILHFFGIFQVPVYEENAQNDVKKISLQISPNPFREKTIIRYRIQDVGQGFLQEPMVLSEPEVSLAIYDATGRVVKSFNLESFIVNQVSAVVWDGTDDAGLRVPSGVYFVRLDSNDKKHTEKVIKID